MLLIRVGDRVRVYLKGGYWQSSGWFEGQVVRIDRYSAHRDFYWVELDTEIRPLGGGSTRLVSVLNPKHIERIDSGPGIPAS